MNFPATGRRGPHLAKRICPPIPSPLPSPPARLEWSHGALWGNEAFSALPVWGVPRNMVTIHTAQFAPKGCGGKRNGGGVPCAQRADEGARREDVEGGEDWGRESSTRKHGEVSSYT